MGPEAVIFDWGGTLSMWADVDLLDMWQLAARHLDPRHEEALTAALIEAEAESWRRTTSSQESTRLGELLAAASDALGLDVAAAVLEEAAQHHLDAWTPHIRHDPDAVPTLTALRDRGLRIGLLSNTHWPRAFHEHFLERDGLAALIDARVYSSDLEHVKPHPQAFRAALEAVGVDDPATAVFVGDRPFDDVHGARGVGMRAVLRLGANTASWAADTSSASTWLGPDAVIESLPELVELVDAWGASSY
jgi:putative hydrolase of the HAD superfamily